MNSVIRMILVFILGISFIFPVYSASWQRINIGGGGAINIVGAGPTGTIVAGTDLAGAYIKRASNAQWQIIGILNNMPDTHITGVVFDNSDANIILLATEGGLYRSENEGVHFTRVDHTSPSSSSFHGGKFLSLAYQQSPTVTSDNRRVYASRISEYKVADGKILRSDDGGKSFKYTAALPIPKNSVITKIVMHPEDPDLVLVLSNKERHVSPKNALYLSDDGGDSWVEIAQSIHNISDVVFHPVAPHYAFISNKPSSAFASIYINDLKPASPGIRDDNWDTVFTTPSYDNEHYTPVLILWPEITNSRTIRALNLYTTWQFSAQTGWRLFYNNGWQQQGLGESSDWSGNKTDWKMGWSKKYTIFSASHESVNHTLGFDLSDPNRILWATNQFVHSGQQITQGNGYTLDFKNLATTGSDIVGWSSTGLDNITPFILDVNSADPEVIYAGLNDLGCTVSRDGGKTWTLCVHNSGKWLEGFEYKKSYGGVATALVSDPSNAASVWMFAAGNQKQNVSPRHSNNYGKLWDRNINNENVPWVPQGQQQPSTRDIYGLSVDPTSNISQRRLFVTIDGVVYMSEDHGKTWSPVYTCNSGCRVTEVASVTDTVSYVYAGGEDGLFVSKNNGLDWKRILSRSKIQGFLKVLEAPEKTTIFDRYDWAGISGIAINPNNPNIVYAAAFIKGDTQGIYKCDVTDAIGVDSDCQLILKNTSFVRDVAIDPSNPNNLYATSSSAYTSGGYKPDSAGVLRSIDGGTVWTELNNGLDWPMAYPIQVNPKNSNIIYVGSPGGGNYKLDLSGCDTSVNIANDQWHQISLPCVLPNNAQSLQAVFSDDISGTYGIDWVVFSYNSSSRKYAKVGLSDVLKQGVGYWIIQLNGSTVTIDLPIGSTQTPVTQTNQCVSAKGCFSIPLATQPSQIKWNMSGHPFSNNITLDRFRIVTNSGLCANGCTLDQARNENIIENKLWVYNGVTYKELEGNAPIHPWTGFWIATLIGSDALEPKLEIPID
ncbi:MAG: hypothetical protein KAH20_07490 [Methylococcales bacterium]|nr:hypothetical protein [Methylococcales bacterium]